MVVQKCSRCKRVYEMHISKAVPGKSTQGKDYLASWVRNKIQQENKEVETTSKKNDLERLEIWCEAMLQIMQETVEERGTKRRKEMLKAEMMGIDKVVGQIRKMRRENEGRNTM